MPIFWESDHSELTYVLHATLEVSAREAGSKGEVIDRLLENKDVGDSDVGVIQPPNDKRAQIYCTT